MHMDIRYPTLALFVLIIGCSNALPQKPAGRPAVKRTQVTKPAAARRIPLYQINLKIADGAKYYVSIISPDQNGRIQAPDLGSLITDLPTGADRFNQPNNVFPRVVVEADPNITMLDFWNPITLFRRNRTDISVSIPVETYRTTLIVPWTSPKDQVDIKPNPLRLIIKLDDDGGLSLNNEPVATLTNTGPLGKRLLEIFREREVNGVFRESTNEIEKSVTMVMPMSSRKFSDLITIATAVWLPGGKPISLVMDDPLADSVDERKNLLDLSPIPPKKKP